MTRRGLAHCGVFPSTAHVSCVHYIYLMGIDSALLLPYVPIHPDDNFCSQYFVKTIACHREDATGDLLPRALWDDLTPCRN